MFSINFKKEWRMNKPLLITFFAVCAGILAFIIVYYLLKDNLTPNTVEYTIANAIFAIISGLSIIIASVLPIVLMFKILKSDLGKNNVQYSIFTPQSVYAWYVPKVLLVIIIQGLFALFNLVPVFLMGAVQGMTKNEQIRLAVTSYLTSTFALATFGLITLLMAVYYSFRKKGTAWTLMVVTFILYGGLTSAYSTSVAVTHMNQTLSVSESMNMALVQYGINTVIGLVMMVLALYLYDKKVEY